MVLVAQGCTWSSGSPTILVSVVLVTAIRSPRDQGLLGVAPLRIMMKEYKYLTIKRGHYIFCGKSVRGTSVGGKRIGGNW